MKISRNYFLVLAALILSIETIQASMSLPNGVVATVSMPKTAFGVDDKMMVTVVYRNTSNRTIKLLKWETALNGGLTEDLFSIQYDDAEIPYRGLHAKRLAPTDKDYISLAPGKSVSATFDLLPAYPIDYKGSYEISLREPGTSLQASELARKVTQPLTISLSVDRPIRLFKRRPNFSNCSASQASSTDAALTSAESIANRAIRDLRGAPVAERPNARRYREWFGAYTAGRYATVERNMARIASALSNQTIGFDCDCTGQPGIDPNNTFAFVFPNDPFNMTLCNVFFRVPRTGTDSKAGTIVHEVSHFNIVAATQDFRPNQAGIRALAISLPDSAIRAANAYEYFAENTPFLSMPAAATAPAPTRSPDLVVRSTSVSDLTASVGQQIEVSGNVLNQGDNSSGATSISLGLVNTATRLQIGSAAVSALAQGQNFGFQFNFITPNNRGEYLVELCVTAVSGESSASNNCSSISGFFINNSSVVAPIIPLLLDD